MAQMKAPLTLSLFLVLASPLGARAEADADTSTTAARPGASRETEVIFVIGSKSTERVAGSAHQIDEAELERFEYDDVQRVLSRIPGVYVRDEDGFGLRPNIGIRGANSERSQRVVLLEDGILLGPAPYAAPAAYFTPLATRMVGFEVFKGPAAVRTGPFTVGGAVNFLTAEVPEGHDGMVDLAAGQFGYLKGHARYGWGNERFGFLVEGLRLVSSGFKELDGGGNTGFEKSEVMAKLRVGSDPADDVYHRLEVKVGWADELSNETYLGLSQSDFDATPFRRYAASRLARMAWERTQVQASYSLWLGEGFEARLTGYRHDFTRAWFKLNRFGSGPDLNQVLDAESELQLGILRGERASSEAGVDSAVDPGVLRIGTNDRTYVSQGVQLDGIWNLEHGRGFAQKLRFGARLHYDEVARDHTEDIYQMEVPGTLRGDLVRTSFPRETTLFNRDEALAFSAYLEDEIQLFEDLLLSPGGRVEVISTRRAQRMSANEPTSPDEVLERTQTVFVPGLGIFYQLVDSVGLIAGVHRGFSPVGPGNPEAVEPEFSWNYEAGARFRSGRTSAEILGFFNDYSNLLLTCSFSAGCRDSEQGKQFNAAGVWVYGLEASGHQDALLPAGVAVAVDARYTLTLSEFRTAFQAGNPQFQEVLVGDRLPYVPEHQVNLTARVSVPLGSVLSSLTLSYTFVDRMRDFASAGEVGDLRLLSIPKALERDDFTDAQHVVDLSLQVDVNDESRIYLRIDNLFDQVYVASRRPFGARPGRPFTAQIGYTHRFGD